MNTILQKRIEEAAKEMSHNKMSFWEDCNYSTKDIEEIIYDACKLVSGYVLQNQWISVEEALPEKRQDVLVAVLDTKSDTYFWGFDNIDDGGCFLRDKNGFAIENDSHKITHWMPIPKMEGGEE